MLDLITLLIIAQVADAIIECGDAKLAQCGSLFSDARCDSKGACCHDDFNAWCCPEGFKCTGVFDDPGGNTHCLTVDKMSSSCQCTDTEFVIVKMESVGTPKQIKGYDSHLQACCESEHTQQCGWSSSFAISNRQTVSWSNTVSVGATMSVEAGVSDLFLAKVGFEVKASFTNGQSTENSQKQTYSSACVCSPDTCFVPWTKLTYDLRYVSTEQEVSLTVRNCGVDKKVPGSVKVMKFEAAYVCDPGTQGFPSKEACLRHQPLNPVPVRYCTVWGGKVHNVFTTLSEADLSLGKNGPTGSTDRMICQVYPDGSVESDPHGIPKGNMWWWNWYSINHMNAVCAGNPKCARG